MIGTFNNIKIRGIVSTVPSYIEDNMKYAPIIGEKRLKKQLRLTGIKKRRVSGRHQRVSDLCYVAAEKLLDNIKWSKDEIDVMVLVTQGPNYHLPSTAFFLQKRLGLSKKCLVFDVNLGCSGFPVGLQIVSALLQQCEKGKKGLLLLGDTAGRTITNEKGLNANQLANTLLFGTAGSATAIELDSESDLRYMNLSDGNGFDSIIKRFNQDTKMDGAAVFEFAINEVVRDLSTFKKEFKLKDEDIDFYIFHQAQKLILDNIKLDCEIPEDKFLVSYEEYGNTSGASVPLTACVNREIIQRKEKANILFSGFGVGLSWGYVLAEIDTNCIYPVVVTDEHYEEDKKNDNWGLGGKNILILGADKPVGESVAREISYKSAKLILAGEDKKILNEISDDLVNESMVIKYENIKSGLKECLSNNQIIDGIIISDYNNVNDVEIINQLIQEGIVNEFASVVIIAQLEKEDKRVYLKEKSEIEDLMNQVVNEHNGRNVRINTIAHSIEDETIIQKEGEAMKWFDKFIESGLPESMAKPVYLAEGIIFLLSDKSKYINKAFMPME